MSVTPTSQTNNTIPANPIGYTVAKPKQVLDSEDFLSLLSAQMSNQDPMEPMKDTDFIAQMASFSSLSSLTQLSKDFTSLSSNQAVWNAHSYLGAEVTVLNKDGTMTTGQVSAVDSSGDEPLLCVDGAYYSVASIQRVQLPQASTSPSGS